MRNDALRERLSPLMSQEKLKAPNPRSNRYAAPLGVVHDRKHLALLVEHRSKIAVIDMRDHVAGFGDPERRPA